MIISKCSNVLETSRSGDKRNARIEKLKLKLNDSNEKLTIIQLAIEGSAGWNETD